VKRVLKVIGKNGGKKKCGLFCIFIRNLGVFCRYKLRLQYTFYQIEVSHPHGKSTVITTSHYRDPNHCHHKAMIIVYNLPKRSGQVYDNWTMM
jgi:hypothetical protein